MPSYYDTNKPTLANAISIIPSDGDVQHFPTEGLYIGNLTGGAVEIPALYDIVESKGLCIMYNNEDDRLHANTCLENLAWRTAMTVPSHLCDIILYNGGNLGDSFNAHTRINKYIYGDRRERLYYDGKLSEFRALLDNIYSSIIDRMSSIRMAGKKNLVELNESLDHDARLKYQFIFITDFPRHIKKDVAQRVSQIIETGNIAGIYVMMTWDMNADFDDSATSDTFNPQQMLLNMELLFPQDGRYEFRNSGHDDMLNMFNFAMDDKQLDTLEIEKCLQYIDIQVEIAKKKAKPTILKQDFDGLEKAIYEPVMSEISVTVGLDIHDKHQVTFRFNSGDYIHGFILGQSGSGKSVLLNNIITSAILKYSPQDLMLYLMDFKGVEFNRYRGVKHTKAVLVDNSDPQMTLEVLRELKEENKKRVKLWQKECVSNIDGYNKKYPESRIPQVLFVADECQVMFKESTSGTERIIQQEIQEILNIIATQGRSQGIHMLLATQQLDETDISGQILKNLTECFLLMSAPSDSDRLVPDSSDLTSKQMTGLACYYHKRELQSQVQTFFAPNDELACAIEAAKQKSSALPGNGEHYFCGSSLFSLSENKELITKNVLDCPISLIGQNIGINAGATTVPLRKDFMEHILFWGANKEEQTTSVLLNSLISLIMSYQQKETYCNFLVIDCLPTVNSRYKPILASLAEQGLCRLVDRQTSGNILKELVDDIKNACASPTVLAIIGSERYIEMKRKMPLVSALQTPISIDDDGMGDLGFDMGSLDFGETKTSEVDTDSMTYPQALMYLLDEGPMHDIHILLQIDKPSNILFGDEYDVDAAVKFRHKVILRSENKFLNPLRFSQDIDVESLSDEEEHLRAYYYPDGDDPVLFTPYQMPSVDNLIH